MFTSVRSAGVTFISLCTRADSRHAPSIVSSAPRLLHTSNNLLSMLFSQCNPVVLYGSAVGKHHAASAVRVDTPGQALHCPLIALHRLSPTGLDAP